MRTMTLLAVSALSWAACTEAGDAPALNDFLNAPPGWDAGGATTATSGTPTTATGTSATTTGAPVTTTGVGQTGTGDVATTAGTTGDTATTGTPVDSSGQTGDTTSEAGAGTTGTVDADAGAEPDAAQPVQSVIPGTYVNCQSYATAQGSQCAGYYCSVTAADVAAEIVPGAGPCSNLEPERICGGRLTQLTGACARSTKSNPLNAFDTDAQLRVKIRDCIYEDPDFDEQRVPVECTECFLDAAQCASDFCLTTCLAGDSPECDQCRLDNNCNQPVPTCGGLPSPF